MSFAAGNRVRHVYRAYGHGTVIDAEERYQTRGREKIVISVTVDWDRPKRITRDDPTVLRKLTVFDRLAGLAGP